MARRTATRIVRANQYRESSEMTMATLKKMEERGFRPSTNKRLQKRSASESFIYDSSAPRYAWLLPGWLAEERVVASKRVYKYYYDPAGRQYKAKYEVLDQWEKLGLIVIKDN